MHPSVSTLPEPAMQVSSGVEKPEKPSRPAVRIIGLAAVAMLLKLVISYSTFGTNDAMTFYGFGRSLSEHGLEHTYRHGLVWLSSSSVFNHPPLTAYFLRGIYQLSQNEILRSSGITFPFLLRLPGILADFGTVLILLAFFRTNPLPRAQRWAMMLFALSPVSIMVSGFHGNTDPVMVFFVVAAGYMAFRGRPSLCGFFLALSYQVKIVPLLLCPIFFFFWWHRRAIVPFLVPMIIVCLAGWSEPLLHFPALFIRNVISYDSYWGLWGITYWFRLTGLPEFSNVWYEHFSLTQKIIVNCLKWFIVAGILVIAWRRRTLAGRGLMESIACAWLIFFVFSPGVCAQYLVWLAPFILVLSPKLYGWTTAASAVFLFFFYNTISHGLPWYMGISTSQLNLIWTPWSVWPWLALMFGLGTAWKDGILPDFRRRESADAYCG